MNSNRLVGIILIVVGIVIGLVAGAWLFTNEGLEGPARILGLGIALGLAELWTSPLAGRSRRGGNGSQRIPGGPAATLLGRQAL